jgi:carboxypeptidase Taq
MLMQIPAQTHPKFVKLRSLLAEIEDLKAAAALLYWDQTIYMPSKGIEARGRQLATLDRIAHEKFTEGTIAHLLDDLTTYERDSPYDSDASLLAIFLSPTASPFSQPTGSGIARNLLPCD